MYTKFQRTDNFQYAAVCYSEQHVPHQKDTQRNAGGIGARELLQLVGGRSKTWRKSNFILK